MLITTTPRIANKKIVKTLGLVRGNTIQTRWIGRDIAAGLKTFVGGEIKGYTEMISRARDQALRRMLKEAKDKGADAVVSVRFTTSTIMGGAAEILAYGTAVKLQNQE